LTGFSVQVMIIFGSGLLFGHPAVGAVLNSGLTESQGIRLGLRKPAD